MTATRSLTRLIAALCAALLLLAACGSDSGEPAAANEDTGGDENAAPADGGGDGGDTNENGGEDDDGGGDLGDPTDGIIDATYATGTAHIEISGGIDRTVDYAQGGGTTGGGQTSLTFFGVDSNNALGLLIGSGGGVSWGADQQAAGGRFGENCDVGLTKNDDTEVAGAFKCEDVPGVDGAESVTVTLEGTFSVKV